MPDPPNVKQPIDTAAAAAAELAALRRGDQVPGYEAPCTRTATGAIPARSRSSYSGGDGTAAGASCDRVPLTRSGSTTATRTQSLVQVSTSAPAQSLPYILAEVCTLPLVNMHAVSIADTITLL